MFQEVLLPDKRQLLIQELADPTQNDWIVFLPGSGAELWDLGWAEQRALFGERGASANLLVINKPGVDAEGRVNKRIFEESFRREQRIADYLEVMRERIPAGARIELVGFSEGAYLAPEIALKDSRVKALALICGGTRSWLDEEIFKARPHELARILKQVARVYANPKSTRLTWFGYSFATWTSYDTDATAEAIRNLNIPILGLFAHGDRLIDVESARGDLESERAMGKPVRTRVFEGVDHTLGPKWLTAWRAVGEFYRSSETMASATRIPSQAALVIPPA